MQRIRGTIFTHALWRRGRSAGPHFASSFSSTPTNKSDVRHSVCSCVVCQRCAKMWKHHGTLLHCYLEIRYVQYTVATGCYYDWRSDRLACCWQLPGVFALSSLLLSLLRTSSNNAMRVITSSCETVDKNAALLCEVEMLRFKVPS